eukprot:CAMPEP_0178662738 /NCGR_PEP_ID=MMETSP0698-20121128/28418_1 /TAXON_ID=265572 /ORGANISM="Extubocellulus spinifer, Strain CCMP396" /LENGTH=184 /DNA_ID=CAMNT_0020305681 /DNA_START=157 /DNA_END=708 /DNA_ORIENTATION=-
MLPISPTNSSLMRLTAQRGYDANAVIGTVGNPRLLPDGWVEVPPLGSIPQMQAGGGVEGNVARTVKSSGNLDNLGFGSAKLGNAHRYAEGGSCVDGTAGGGTIHAGRLEHGFLISRTARSYFNRRRTCLPPVLLLRTNQGLTLVSNGGFGGKGWTIIDDGTPAELRAFGWAAVDAAWRPLGELP